ncbi:MAG: phenylacetate--CoA ligase [Candidatus Poribacteria bacterium]|nr:phenylacetate--CoA ligase [Candidatus Poribacteria bacterium]
MSWEESVEFMPRERLEMLQLERLRGVLHRVAETVPYYKRIFEKQKIQPDDIKSLDDVAQLPFTTKADLRDNYPFGMFAVPLKQIVRVHASSGTTGKPTVVGYTRHDMDVWAEVMTRTLSAGDVTASDVVHNAYGYGLFTGGLGFGLGAETIGAATVPVSGGFTKRQLMLMEDFGATVLCCTPSYALVLAETAEDEGIDFRKRMKLRVGFMGAEPWSEAIRSEIEGRMGIEAFDVYGLSEVIGPGVAGECHAHAGLHIFEDHFLAEIIDPDTGARLPDDSEGELVLTTLTKTGMPVIRYRTRDCVRLSRKPCACGRALARMSKVLGRTDDMLIIRGVNVFPSQIEAALLNVDGLAPQYQIVVDRRANRLDDLEVWVEATAATYRDGESAFQRMQEQVTQHVQHTLGINVRVRVVAPGGIQRSEGKAVRVIDRRQMQ